jgi:type VI secretion system protein ImpK
MAEDSKQAFDPDATVKQALAGDDPEATVTRAMPLSDPDATVAMPVPVSDPDATVAQPIPVGDPDATITQPLKALDPEATLSGPQSRLEPDAETTDRRPAFDPDATDRHVAFDPEATVRRAPSPALQRSNPFAPKAPPETIQANLAALGGVNPLVSMANQILAAVPQIRRSLKHPDPAGLLSNLRDQIESFETSAVSAEYSDETVSTAIYALCALLDESAAATPWGHDWIKHGLLHAMRGERDGAQDFFTHLDKASIDPEKNAELLEFLYICLALGFEGRHRATAGGAAALDMIKASTYELIARCRPRPEELSAHWRTPAAQTAAEAALQTAARASALRAAETAARAANARAPHSEPAAKGFTLSQLPRRAIWSGVAGMVGAAIVLYMLALRLQDDESRSALASKSESGRKAGAAATNPQPPVATPAPAAAANPEPGALAKSLAALPVTLTEQAGTLTIALRDEQQFRSGSTQPSAQAQAVIAQIAVALDKAAGSILVIGHADATPAGHQYATNSELSAARARAAARIVSARLADPKRVTAEGKADADPLAPNDTDQNRARNRRVVIQFKASP